MGKALLNYNTPLTEAERQFSEQWHDIIYKFLNEKRLPESEYYDVVVLAYIRAVKKYLNIEQLQQYSFVTISFASMRSAINNYRRSELSKAGRNIHDTDEYNFIDNIADETDISEYVCVREYCSAQLEKILLALNKEERKIFYLKSLGRTESEIAKVTGCESHRGISKKILNARRRIEKMMKGGIVTMNTGSKFVDYDKVTQLYEQGLRDKEVAGGANCSLDTVKRWRKKNSLPSNSMNRKRGGVPTERAGVSAETKPKAEAAASDTSVSEGISLNRRINAIVSTIRHDDLPETIELYKTFTMDLFGLFFDKYVEQKQNR